MLTFIVRTVLVTLDIIALLVVLFYLAAGIHTGLHKLMPKRKQPTPEFKGYKLVDGWFDEIDDFRSDFN